MPTLTNALVPRVSARWLGVVEGRARVALAEVAGGRVRVDGAQHTSPGGVRLDELSRGTASFERLGPEQL